MVATLRAHLGLAALLVVFGCASDSDGEASAPDDAVPAPTSPQLAGALALLDDFEADVAGGTPARWQAVSLGDQQPTHWAVVAIDGGHALRATAEGAASGLALRVGGGGSQLRWRWRVEQRADATADERTRAGDDFAARVLVTFASRPGSTLLDAAQDAAARLAGHEAPPAAAIAYVFARELPSGESFSSPYTERVSTLVVRGRDDATGCWYAERRDLAADFERLFGGPMPPVTGVQLLTDSDDAGGTACALYDDLALEGVAAH